MEGRQQPQPEANKKHMETPGHKVATDPMHGDGWLCGRGNKDAREATSKMIGQLQRGANQKWPTSGQGGYITPAAWEVPTASEQGAKSEVAHLWARWLHNPCRLGGPHRFKAGGRIRNGPKVGEVPT